MQRVLMNIWLNLCTSFASYLAMFSSDSLRFFYISTLYGKFVAIRSSYSLRFSLYQGFCGNTRPFVFLFSCLFPTFFQQLYSLWEICCHTLFLFPTFFPVSRFLWEYMAFHFHYLLSFPYVFPATLHFVGIHGLLLSFPAR